MTQAERACRAKLPGSESGITVRHTLCDICTPGAQCGIDAYVKDDTVIKVEGTPGFPGTDGKLCTKGAASRQYIYREDRIKTPMRRIGPKGIMDSYVPIDWDEAIALTAGCLNDLKEMHGAESVAFGCGYPKWFRPWLQRLAHSFGSPNYFTESSTCNSSGVMASKTMFGCPTGADLGRTQLLLCWGSSGVVSRFQMKKSLEALHARGGKIVVIDPRRTPTALQHADLYLCPKVGTDAALAHAVANLLIRNGWYDGAYVARYVHGFEEYRDYVAQFDLARAEELTGVKAEQIVQLTELLRDIRPAAVAYGTSLGHHTNGFNIYRSLYSLIALTGNFDVPGGVLPRMDGSFAESDGGFISREEEFINDTRPHGRPAIGAEKFPLWDEIMRQAQGMEFVRQVTSGEPYPIKGALLFGVNHRMYPESPKLLGALDRLDFVAAADMFWTETCLHADIVFPVCSSFERSEAKCYANRFLYYTTPVIKPLGESCDDVEVMTSLACAMALDDPLLCGGYRACADFMLEPAGFENLDDVLAAGEPVLVPNAGRIEAGAALAAGLATPSGKIELYSERIARLHRENLDPLPIYEDSDDPSDPAEYPMTLMAGARLFNAIHSRLHAVSWTRALRPEPMADLHPDDAARLGIAQGDAIEIATSVSAICVKANLTYACAPGDVHFYHDYPEANVNDLIPDTMLDPYTGFPSFKQIRCRVRPCGGERK